MRKGWQDGDDGRGNIIGKPTTPLGYFSQSFTTFRGVKMGEQKWFDAYLNKVGWSVYMPGTTSTSSDLGVALAFSNCSIDDIDIPGKSVLFVFFFRNYKEFGGFRLNKPEYSAFPFEEEYLLMEGIDVWVLRVDENVVIKNETKALRE